MNEIFQAFNRLWLMNFRTPIFFFILMNNTIWAQEDGDCLAALIRNDKDRKVTITEILSSPYVICPCDWGFPEIDVISFLITYGSGDLLVELSQYGSNKLSFEQMAWVMQLKPGDMIFIENIKVRMPDSTTRKLSPFTLRIDGL